MLVRDVAVGTRIILSYNLYGGVYCNYKDSYPKVKATVVVNDPNGPYKGSRETVLVGFSDKAQCCWSSRNGESLYVGSLLKQGLEYAYWLVSDLEVKLDCFLPDQKCIDCGITCPHAEPNKGDQYLCIACRVYGELA